MDIYHTHSTDIHVLRVCPYDDCHDLVAIGGDHGVDILRMDGSRLRTIASFHIGSRVTALTWSPKSVSPSLSNYDWILELAAASADCGLYLLTKKLSEECVFRFGGGLTGHHGRINGVAFCGGRGENSLRYLGSVSDDKMLMIWDLHPNHHLQASIPSVEVSRYTHLFSDKEFLVADCKGSVYITDWKSDPERARGPILRHSNVVELTNPSAVVSAAGTFGSVAWQPENPKMVGASCGHQPALWDITTLRGGQPFRNEAGFPGCGDIFRWCFTYPEYFATATREPNDGAYVHVYNLNYLNVQPMAVRASLKQDTVDAFDFIGLEEGVLRVALAVGRKLVVLNVSTEKLCY